MKIAIPTFLIFFSSVAFSQTDYVEIKQEFLVERSDLGAWEVLTNESKLDTSLSKSLMPNVMQSSGPYTIANMHEIEALIEGEKTKFRPNLKLSLNTFAGSDPLNVSIDRIDTRYERNILRGQVDGFEGSQVKLVVYNGQMTGRITFASKQSVLVIRSIDGGISANYEVDTSDITYD